MNKTKAIFTFAVVSVLAVSASLFVWRATIAATEPSIKVSSMIGSELPLEVMFEKTSGIVVAKLSDVHVKYAPSKYEPGGQDIMTYATAHIEESIKALEGNPKKIEVRTLGGEIGNVKQEAIGGAILRDGDRVLLFLADNIDGAYEIAGWKMGWYPLNDRNEYKVEHDVDAGDDLHVTGLPDSANLQKIKEMYELHKNQK